MRTEESGTDEQMNQEKGNDVTATEFKNKTYESEPQPDASQAKPLIPKNRRGRPMGRPLFTRPTPNDDIAPPTTLHLSHPDQWLSDAPSQSPRQSISEPTILRLHLTDSEEEEHTITPPVTSQSVTQMQVTRKK